MRRKNSWIKLGSVILVIFMIMTGCGKSTDAVEQEDFSKADAESAASGDAIQESAGTAQSGDAIQESTGTDQPDDGSKMPDFTAKDLDGNTVTESIFSEKDLTVVNIWGTFCGPCVGEMPELGTWAKDMPDNVQLIGLIIDIAGDDDTEHHDQAVSIIQNASADFVNIVANEDFSDILKDVVGVPTTIFVDKDGNIVGDSILGANVDGYKEFVEEYLNGQ